MMVWLQSLHSVGGSTIPIFWLLLPYVLFPFNMLVIMANINVVIVRYFSLLVVFACDSPATTF